MTAGKEDHEASSLSQVKTTANKKGAKNSGSVRKPYVKRACTNCKKAHAACTEGRPCKRCKQLGIGHECVDSERKKPTKRARRIKKTNATETNGNLEDPLMIEQLFPGNMELVNNNNIDMEKKMTNTRNVATRKNENAITPSSTIVGSNMFDSNNLQSFYPYSINEFYTPLPDAAAAAYFNPTAFGVASNQNENQSFALMPYANYQQNMFTMPGAFQTLQHPSIIYQRNETKVESLPAPSPTIDLDLYEGMEDEGSVDQQQQKSMEKQRPSPLFLPINSIEDKPSVSPMPAVNTPDFFFDPEELQSSFPSSSTNSNIFAGIDEKKKQDTEEEDTHIVDLVTRNAHSLIQGHNRPSEDSKHYNQVSQILNNSSSVGPGRPTGTAVDKRNLGMENDLSDRKHLDNINLLMGLLNNTPSTHNSSGITSQQTNELLNSFFIEENGGLTQSNEDNTNNMIVSLLNEVQNTNNNPDNNQAKRITNLSNQQLESLLLSLLKHFMVKEANRDKQIDRLTHELSMLSKKVGEISNNYEEVAKNLQQMKISNTEKKNS